MSCTNYIYIYIYIYTYTLLRMRTPPPNAKAAARGFIERIQTDNENNKRTRKHKEEKKHI